MFVDDLVSPLRVVSVRDPAIDWATMRARGVSPRVYAETRDADSVCAIPGKHPRWYVLRALTVGECAMIDAVVSQPAQRVQAFRLAVSEIHDFHGPGAALRPTLPVPAAHGGTRMVWSDEDLQHVADVAGGMRLLYEIGDIAYERAAEGNARSGDVLFTPPPFLQPELDRIERHLAARRQATAGTGSSANQASGSPRASAKTSVAPTAANAASGQVDQGAEGRTI